LHSWCWLHVVELWITHLFVWRFVEILRSSHIPNVANILYRFTRKQLKSVLWDCVYVHICVAYVFSIQSSVEYACRHVTSYNSQHCNTSMGHVENEQRKHRRIVDVCAEQKRPFVLMRLSCDRDDIVPAAAWLRDRTRTSKTNLTHSPLPLPSLA
jgi:hypothetical protein